MIVISTYILFGLTVIKFTYQTAMHHSPEYITTQLSHILTTLQQDIDANNAKHHHQLALLRQIIHTKDEEINSLHSQLKKYRQTHKQTTASFKRITLAKKTNKSVSNFASELSNVNMAESVLVDQTNHNHSIKYIKPLPLKNLLPTTVSVSSVKTPRLPKSRAKDKQNTVVSVKKQSFQKPKRRSNSHKQQQSKQMQKQKGSQRKIVNRSSEKKCINIVLPTANFSAYSVKTSKTNASEGGNV